MKELHINLLHLVEEGDRVVGRERHCRHIGEVLTALAQILEIFPCHGGESAAVGVQDRASLQAQFQHMAVRGDEILRVNGGQRAVVTDHKHRQHGHQHQKQPKAPLFQVLAATEAKGFL